MLDDYEYQERLAIRMDSHMDYETANRLTDAEQPKEDSEAVKRAKALRAKIAADKLNKHKTRGMQ